MMARAALVLTMTVLLTACGGSGGGGGDQASDATVPLSAPTSGGAADQVPGGDGDFCDAVKAQFAQLAAVNEALSADPEVRRQFYVRQKDLNAQVVDTAPAGAVRSDVELHVGASDAVADAHLFGDQAARAAAVDRLTSPEVEAAGTRVAAYVKDHCGFEATSSGG